MVPWPAAAPAHSVPAQLLSHTNLATQLGDQRIVRLHAAWLTGIIFRP